MASSKGPSKLVRYLQGVAGGRKLDLLMPDGLQSKQIALKIDSAHEASAEEDEKRATGKRRSGTKSKKSDKTPSKKAARKKSTRKKR